MEPCAGRRLVTDETTDIGKHQHVFKAMIREWGFVLRAMERRVVSREASEGM